MLLFFQVNVDAVDEDTALTTWAVERNQITSIFAFDLNLSPEEFEADIDALISAAVETQPTIGTP